MRKVVKNKWWFNSKNAEASFEETKCHMIDGQKNLTLFVE